MKVETEMIVIMINSLYEFDPPSDFFKPSTLIARIALAGSGREHDGELQAVSHVTCDIKPIRICPASLCNHCKLLPSTKITPNMNLRLTD